MLKSKIMTDDNKKRNNPNLFRAARENDVEEMNQALASGKRLDEPDFENGFTPLHYAAFTGSADFIRAALDHPSADPWKRDHQGYLAIDHADARGDQVVSKLFFEAMYPGGELPLTPEP